MGSTMRKLLKDTLALWVFITWEPNLGELYVCIYAGYLANVSILNDVPHYFSHFNHEHKLKWIETGGTCIASCENWCCSQKCCCSLCEDVFHGKQNPISCRFCCLVCSAVLVVGPALIKLGQFLFIFRRRLPNASWACMCCVNIVIIIIHECALINVMWNILYRVFVHGRTSEVHFIYSTFLFCSGIIFVYVPLRWLMFSMLNSPSIGIPWFGAELICCFNSSTAICVFVFKWWWSNERWDGFYEVYIIYCNAHWMKLEDNGHLYDEWTKGENWN